MNIEDVLSDPSPLRMESQARVDALRESAALQEAQLIAFRADVVRSQAWFIFDCRTALGIREGNTGLLRLSGLRSLTWAGNPIGRLTAWNVIEWRPKPARRVWSLSAVFAPSARLDVQSEAASFLVGNVPGGDEPPPDFLDADDAADLAGIASWTSPFDVRCITTVAAYDEG